MEKWILVGNMLNQVGLVLISMWPLSPEQTVHLGLEVTGVAWAVLGCRDWNQIKLFIIKKCEEVEALDLTNDEKAETVVNAVWEILPKKLKAVPWITKKSLKFSVSVVYQTLVKPRLKQLREKLKAELAQDGVILPPPATVPVPDPGPVTSDVPSPPVIL